MLCIPVLHIDANLINAKQKLESVNQLERWHDAEIIMINMSSVARSEAMADANQDRTRKANTRVYTVTPPIDDEDTQFKLVEAALFPCGAKDENQRNDIRIVCEAAKYAAILITNDGASKTQPGGILGNRDKLRNFVQIMLPDEAVAFVRGKIHERDEFNRQVASEIGGELPTWTGQG